jgi:hypothetical protein
MHIDNAILGVSGVRVARSLATNWGPHKFPHNRRSSELIGLLQVVET